LAGISGATQLQAVASSGEIERARIGDRAVGVVHLIAIHIVERPGNGAAGKPVKQQAGGLIQGKGPVVRHPLGVDAGMVLPTQHQGHCPISGDSHREAKFCGCAVAQAALEHQVITASLVQPGNECLRGVTGRAQRGVVACPHQPDLRPALRQALELVIEVIACGGFEGQYPGTVAR